MSRYDIPGVRTFEFSRIIGIENITFGTNIIIDDFAFVYATGKMTIGNYVHIACFSSMAGGGEITIDDFVAVSHGARVLSGSDDFKEWGFGNSTVELKYRNVKRAPVRIGRFCIIGANSVVLPGVTIGEGAMVGAGSVVTKDVEPWAVYAGTRIISRRDKEAVMKNFNRFQRDQL